VDSDGGGGVETSFAQHKKKEKQKDKQKFRIQCWTCGEYGHMAQDCRSGQSNTQIDQVDESNILASWNNWNS
jgi:ribosomal protein L44E